MSLQKYWNETVFANSECPLEKATEAFKEMKSQNLKISWFNESSQHVLTKPEEFLKV